MIKLGVNIDHVATIRQARRTFEPDPVTAATLAVLGGADIITVHLREDRRHIQDRDVKILRDVVFTKLNLEMSSAPEIVNIALEIKPEQVTLVPEKRQEVTTEGGLNVVSQKKALAEVVRKFKDAGILVSLFIDPEE
ncbi:MAG TPA: pyridoxine 5'-phosphate synthase, partial [Candidatus Brocadiaceae bacterium]